MWRILDTVCPYYLGALCVCLAVRLEWPTADTLCKHTVLHTELHLCMLYVAQLIVIH